MVKKREILSIAPKSVSCPFCRAGRGKPCKTRDGRALRKALGVRVALLHVARIAKAAEMDSIVA